MSKIFYAVQVTERKNCGYKTHIDIVKEKKLFEEKDKKKAVSLFKKRKANTIWRHEVTILDAAPYYKDNWCEGRLMYDEESNYYRVKFYQGKELVETI